MCVAGFRYFCTLCSTSQISPFSREYPPSLKLHGRSGTFCRTAPRMTTGLRDVSLRHKNHQTQKRKTNQIIRTNPPLSAETEAAFYVEEEERCVYDDFWRNMAYYIRHGGDFPPVIGTINLQLLQGYA